MPGYDDNYTNKASIVDGATNAADHVKSLYDELGANPSGGAADLATRLSSMIDGDGTITDVVAVTQAEYDAIDPYDATTLYVIDGGLSFAIGGTNTPPPSGWTLEGDPPPAPEVLSGYTRTWLEDFDDDAWKADYWVKNGTWQGDPWPQGTVSVQSSANVITTSGVARFKVDDNTATIGTYTRPYTSSEVESLASARLPLTGRYETCMRAPMGHANWWCWWFTAGGSYNNLEVDITEMFHAETPGRSSTVMHSTDGHGGDDLRGYLFAGPAEPNQTDGNYASTDAYAAGGRWHLILPNSWPNDREHWDGTAMNGYNGKAFPWVRYQDGGTDPQPWVGACVEIYKTKRNASVGSGFWSDVNAGTVNPTYIWEDQSVTSDYTIVMEFSRNYYDGNGWQKYLVFVDPYDPVNGATGSLPWEQEGTNNVPFWVGRLLDGSVTEDKFWENKFDHWIGGEWIGAALDHASDAGTPSWGSVAKQYTYTGLLQRGTAGSNATYVTDSTAARYPMYMDIAWQQRLETPIPNPPPAGTLNTGATFNLAAVGSPADGTAVSDINSSSPNSNLSDLADDTGGDGVATSATWQTDSPFPETTYTIEHATAVSGRSMMKYSYGSDFSQFAARMLIQFNGSAVYDGDGHEIIMIAKTAADAPVAYLRMDSTPASNSDHVLRLSATGNSTVNVTGATTTNMTTGKLYGIEMIFDYQSASSVDITVRVLNITDGTWVTSVAGFTQNYTTVTNSTTIQKIWFGSDQATLDATKPFRTGAYAVSVGSTNTIGFYEDDPTS